jgi:hypothetical protein
MNASRDALVEASSIAWEPTSWAANLIESEGHNLASDGSCFLTAPGDLPSHNPLLGPLAFNGGTTQTEALLAGSPAVGAGATQGCPQKDQRGVARPGGSCSVGAYQYAPGARRSTSAQAKRKGRRKATRRRGS